MIGFLHSLVAPLYASGSVLPPDAGLRVVLGWSLAALVLGALLMLGFNLIQNPPWSHDDDPPGPRPGG